MTQLEDRTTSPSDATSGPSRRQVLVTGGVVAAAAAVTAACGASGSTSASSTSPANGSATGSPAASSAAASTPAATSGIQVATADVPVGGGTILADQKVVVTQPVAGTYKAFSAVCTHQGCTVASVANGTITCPCHGSTFSAADGTVQGGPAPAPLASIPVTVTGAEISVQV